MTYSIQIIRLAIESLSLEYREVSVSLLELPVRVSNILKNSDVDTLGQILEMPIEDILKFPNMGRKSVNDLADAVEKFVKTLNQNAFVPKEILPDYSDDPVISSILPHIENKPYIWVEAYLQNFPAHEEHFSELEISGDVFYVIHRKKLSKEIRNSADNFRFKTILPLVNKYNHQSILAIAPAWLLDMSFERVEASIRTKNCLKNDNINKFSDLLDRDQQDMLKTPNFGRKSLNELPDMIIDAYHKGVPPDIENSNDYAIPLKKCFLEALSSLKNEKHQTVLEGRFGIKGEVKTLAEIANLLGLSKARIGQICNQQVQKIKKTEYWIKILEIKLDKFFEEIDQPIYIEEIGERDGWFKGFEKDGDLLLKIIESFTGKKLFLLPVDEKNLISNVPPYIWEHINRSTLQGLRNTINMGRSISDIEILVRHEFEGRTYFPYLIKAMREQIVLQCVVEDKNDKLIIIKVR